MDHRCYLHLVPGNSMYSKLNRSILLLEMTEDAAAVVPLLWSDSSVIQIEL